MKSIKRLLALPLLALVFLLAPVDCGEDGSDAYFTGKTRTSASGKHMKQYKCYLYGHLFWVAAT